MSQAPVIDQNSEAFEKAWFTNSYPKESSKVESLASCIRYIAIVAIFIEVACSASLGTAVYQYS